MAEDYDEKVDALMYRRLILSGFTHEGAATLRMTRGGIYHSGIQKVKRNRRAAVKRKFKVLAGTDWKRLWEEAQKEIRKVDDFHLPAWMQTRGRATTAGGKLWFEAVLDVEEERWRNGFIEASAGDYFLQYYLGLRRKMSRKEQREYAEEEPSTKKKERLARKLKRDTEFISMKQKEKALEDQVLRGDIE